MITNYKLVGLERLHNPDDISATLEYLDKEETFKSFIEGTKEQKEAMWNYCKGDWSNKKIAEVKHEGIMNGYPMNPRVVSFYHQN